ncbi:hypothetical protein EVAR_60938_1 [Eumeta japonica]|uniref:Uncharacterized protein n=1 Tax=Eumeta variegata TaxID=151549 RepID=A0A4C1ZHP9_EUMVA|nr:hypothetical protein EVAR_60938_1 [Eumeta japonica]
MVKQFERFTKLLRLIFLNTNSRAIRRAHEGNNTTCMGYELMRLTVKQKMVHRNVPSKESVLERRTCEPKIAESTDFDELAGRRGREATAAIIDISTR